MMTNSTSSELSQLKPKVCVVVLTWNDTEMTRACLESVYRSTYQNFSVILVDNGSSEPCGQILKAQFPEIELIELETNRGFTGGSNVGLSRALNEKAEYIFFSKQRYDCRRYGIGNTCRKYADEQ